MLLQGTGSLPKSCCYAVQAAQRRMQPVHALQPLLANRALRVQLRVPSNHTEWQHLPQEPNRCVAVPLAPGQQQQPCPALPYQQTPSCPPEDYPTRAATPSSHMYRARLPPTLRLPSQDSRPGAQQ